MRKAPTWESDLPQGVITEKRASCREVVGANCQSLSIVRVSMQEMAWQQNEKLVTHWEIDQISKYDKVMGARVLTVR